MHCLLSLVEQCLVEEFLRYLFSFVQQCADEGFLLRAYLNCLGSVYVGKHFEKAGSHWNIAAWKEGVAPRQQSLLDSNRYWFSTVYGRTLKELPSLLPLGLEVCVTSPSLSH